VGRAQGVFHTTLQGQGAYLPRRPTDGWTPVFSVKLQWSGFCERGVTGNKEISFCHLSGLRVGEVRKGGGCFFGKNGLTKKWKKGFKRKQKYGNYGKKGSVGRRQAGRNRWRQVRRRGGKRVGHYRKKERLLRHPEKQKPNGKNSLIFGIQKKGLKKNRKENIKVCLGGLGRKAGEIVDSQGLKNRGGK